MNLNGGSDIMLLSYQHGRFRFKSICLLLEFR